MPDNESDGEMKKKKGTWDPANMHKAVEKVLNNEMSARQAADCYQVPRTTLNDRISAIRNNKEVSIKPAMCHFHKTFSAEHEEVLVEHVKDLANRLMLKAKDRQEFLYLAFQLAEKLKLPHQFNKEKMSAGKNYYYSFMKRHSDLSLRTAESTSSQQSESQSTADIDQSVDNFKVIITELSPVPDASKRRATARRHKAERSEIYTSSPYKKVLEQKRADKRRVESAKRGKSLLSGQDVSKKGKSLLSGKDVSKKGKKNKKENQSPPHRSIQEETFCPLCLESHEEDWIQCGNCKICVHEAFANISELSNQYICDYCLV